MAIYKFLFICVVIFSYLAAVPVYNTDEKRREFVTDHGKF